MRHTNPLTHIDLEVTDDVETTGDINFTEYAGGIVFAPENSAVASLTAYASPNGTDYFPLYQEHPNEASICVLTVTAGRCYPLPIQVFSASHIKLVGNVAGTVQLSLKS